MAKAKVAELLRDGGIIDARAETDTIRLWENYRDQATLWRAIALLQIPATVIALVFAMVVWTNRSITLKVPPKPLPGQYVAQEIPDAEYINIATDFVNLISSYQPMVARRQYEKARSYLVEPKLSQFETDMMNFDLKAIESTTRTQIFFVDPTKTETKRGEREVRIAFSGERLKIVAGKELPLAKTRYEVTLTTMPRNSLNPYGIVVSDYKITDLS